MAQIGRYEIIKELGRGGMAVVYQARDPKLDRVVAIKLIQADAFAAKLFGHIRERFEREARALARLDHPNIVRVLDYGEHEGAPYLVMEYLEGATLKDVRKPLRVDTAIRLISPIAEALSYVHQNGILHRDVKPSNIMILKDNKVMLTDFGIAKWIEDQEDRMALTGTGIGVGTPEYMAPEQGLGGKVDARTDQYSLAIVFYELITGQKPYRGETPLSVLMKQANDPIPDPRAIVPETNESVKKFLDRAMAKNPDDRYPDWDDFLRDLDGLRLQAIAARIDQGNPPVTRTGVLVDPNAAAADGMKTSSSVMLHRADVEEIRDLRSADPDAPAADAKAKKRGSAKRWVSALVILAFILGGGAAALQYLGLIELPLPFSTVTQSATLTPIASETARITMTLTSTSEPAATMTETVMSMAQATEVIVVEKVVTATPDMAMTAMRETADMALTQAAEAEKRLEAAHRSATEEALMRVQTEAAKAETRIADINLQSTELALALTQSSLERTSFVLTQDAHELMMTTPTPGVEATATMTMTLPPTPTETNEPTAVPSGPKASWVVWASQRGVDAMFGYNVETEEMVELKKNREGKFVLDDRIVLSYKDPVLYMNYPEFLCVGSCTEYEGKSVLTDTNAGTEVVREYRNSGCKQLTCDKAPCPFDCPYSRSRVLLNSHEIFNAADSRFYNAFWYRTGEKFAILSNFAGKMDIYVYEREKGGRMVQLLSEQGVQYTSPTWSYDGTKIYFARYDYAGNKNFDIVAIPADGKTHRKEDIEFLSTSPEDEQFPAISPDGRYLAFNRRLEASYEMMVLDLETGEEKRLTNDIVQDILPMWIPD